MKGWVGNILGLRSRRMRDPDGGRCGDVASTAFLLHGSRMCGTAGWGLHAVTCKCLVLREWFRVFREGEGDIQSAPRLVIISPLLRHKLHTSRQPPGR